MGKRPNVGSVQGDRGQALRYAADEGVLVADVEGRITLVNPAAERILGVPSAELVGRPYSEVLEPIGREGTEGLAGAAQQLVSCPLPGAAKVIRVGVAAGAQAVEMRLSPILDVEGRVAGVVGVLRDLTKDAEIDRARSEFISAVSHELRGPATSIKGYADLLQSEAVGPLSAAQKELIGVLKRNSDRMADLINDLAIKRNPAFWVQLKLNHRHTPLSERYNELIDYCIISI